MPTHYARDTLTALDAISEAQRIAFAPMLFQAAVSLRDSGILQYLDTCGKHGATLEDIINNNDLDEYATGLLLDMGLSGRIFTRNENRYYIAKVGHFLLHDTMTKVNMDFTRDVCYQGLFHLGEAFKTGRPAGLKVFGEWPTIYPALSQLPEPARSSWFAFDHYYSDTAFDAVLPYVFAQSPTVIYDIGGNTGKWARRCCEYSHNVHVTIIDLAEQIALARNNTKETPYADRIHFHPTDMLSDAVLPGYADIWWMSQFLDCFSPEHIVNILKKIASVMKPEARLCIMELFWDAQQFEAAAFSLNASSLYFTCMANGYSRFYSAEHFISLIKSAGFTVENQINSIGIGHTLLMCRKTIHQ